MEHLKQISLSLPLRELLLFFLTFLLFSTLPAQVTIKERAEIKPKSATSLSSTANLEIVLSWISYADEGESHRPMQLRILDPGNNYHGFDPYTESASGNYSSQILDDEGTYYTGQTTYIDNAASPGWYTIEALGDTLTVSHYYGDVYADIYINNEWSTGIVFSFRYEYGSIPGTRYVSVQKYNRIFGEADPCVPGTLQFSFEENLDLQDGGLQHGNLTSFFTSILGTCVDTLVPYYKYELLGDSMTWGYLRVQNSTRTGTVLDSVSLRDIEFDAWGKNPEVPQAVSLRVSSEDGSIIADTVTFNVLPANARVISGKSTSAYADTIQLIPGDTTLLTMQIRSTDGSWTEKPTNWAAIYNIVKADTFGFLYSPDSSQAGSNIDGYPSVIYSAYQKTEPDSIEVLIQLVSHEPFDTTATSSARNNGIREQLPKTKSLPTKGGFTNLRQRTSSMLSDYNSGMQYGLARLVIKKQHSILLGETKYYHADTVKGKLQIKESKTPVEEGIPGLQFTVERYPVNDSSGKRLGVYYEYRDTSGERFQDTTQQIRLIGRYWSADSNYFVRLSATNGSLADSIIIEVKKPGSLLSPGQKPTYRLSKDVFYNTIKIDSLCIALGGKYGIPPHMLKGQMMKEAWHRNRDETTGFAPTYRYEPYTTQFNKKYFNGLFLTNRFRIRDNGDMGTDPVPTDHNNVELINYPTEKKSVWDMIKNYSDLGDNPQFRMYGKYKDGSSELTFSVYGYTTIQNIYDKILSISKKFFNVDSFPEYLDSALIKARDSISIFLENDWNGGIKDNTMGLKNIPAQTRIASSYGLLQILYPEALFFGYDSTLASNTPEMLDIDSIGLPLAMKKHLKNLRDTLHTSPESNNWSIGFDAAMKGMFKRWHRQGGYAQEVINNANLFLPKRKTQGIQP